jgi:hypothetical protein
MAQRTLTGALRPNDLHDHNELAGTTVVVDVFEALWDSEHSSDAGPGEYDVDVVDVGAWRFKITPGEAADERAAGALAALPSDLRPPIRAHGIVKTTKVGVRLIAHRLEQLSFPAPTRIPNANVITKDPKAWHGKYVEVEDDWSAGFEASWLGEEGPWLVTYPSATIRCEPPGARPKGRFPLQTRRVRVIGFAYTATRSYGHLGAAPAKLIATSITYIDPRRPECR